MSPDCWILLWPLPGKQDSSTYHEEGRVDHPPGCGDDLTSTPVEGFLGNHSIQDLKLDVPNH